MQICNLFFLIERASFDYVFNDNDISIWRKRDFVQFSGYQTIFISLISGNNVVYK